MPSQTLRVTVFLLLTAGTPDAEARQSSPPTPPATPAAGDVEPAEPAPPESEATARAFDMEAALAALRQQIQGREQEPAEQVFRDIEVLRGMPAGRLLRVMEMGFAGSLGVACTHCHVDGQWASDEKRQKQVARDMWLMVGKINQELLPAIPNLEGKPPTVNCTTCHRGDVKPALTLSP